MEDGPGTRPLGCRPRVVDVGENEISQCSFSSGQAYAPEKIFKALISAIAVNNRVDGEVSHPDSAIVIGGLQPLECVLILV